MPRSPWTRAESHLRQHALAYPEAYEEFPWGERALKVNGKIFFMMYRNAEVFGLTMKLPISGKIALGLPFASPTGYGLGKSGWVSARFVAGQDVPVEMIKEWVDESYRAIAPKRLMAQLEGESSEPSAAAKRRTSKKTKKRARR